MPRLLLDERETSRQEEAVDTETGRVPSYARRDIPKANATKPDGTLAWPEAVVPGVGPRKKTGYTGFPRLYTGIRRQKELIK
jgi:hypothetical protein